MSSLKIEDVSQNSFVFKLADRQIDGSKTRTVSTTPVPLNHNSNYNNNYITLHYANYSTLPYNYNDNYNYNNDHCHYYRYYHSYHYHYYHYYH